MNDRLEDKVAIVTGGTSGIGAAIAHRFAQEGAAVVVVGRNRAAADDLVSHNNSISFLEGDVCDLERNRAIVEAVMDRYSRIDMLVNSAGIGGKGQTFVDTDSNTLQRVIAVNLFGTFYFAQDVAKAMIGRGGVILNISSISGQRGNVLRSAYGASKSAVIHLTLMMAVELAAHKIRVNAIAPGPIETPMALTHTPDVRAAYEAMIPLRRYGTAQEVAAAAVFLVSDEASYITGHTLNVDGGFLAAGFQTKD